MGFGPAVGAGHLHLMMIALGLSWRSSATAAPTPGDSETDIELWEKGSSTTDRRRDHPLVRLHVIRLDSAATLGVGLHLSSSVEGAGPHAEGISLGHRIAAMAVARTGNHHWIDISELDCSPPRSWPRSRRATPRDTGAAQTQAPDVPRGCEFPPAPRLRSLPAADRTASLPMSQKLVGDSRRMSR
jgi:hypothetical protein